MTDFVRKKTLRTSAFDVDTILGSCRILLSKNGRAEWVWLVKFMETHLKPHYATVQVEQGGELVTKKDIIAIAHKLARRHQLLEMRASGEIDEETDKRLMEGVAFLLDREVDEGDDDGQPAPEGELREDGGGNAGSPSG